VAIAQFAPPAMIRKGASVSGHRNPDVRSNDVDAGIMMMQCSINLCSLSV
jgi:hypothetical protein